MVRWLSENYKGLLGVILVAILLTFGNVLVEVVFRALGL